MFDHYILKKEQKTPPNPNNSKSFETFTVEEILKSFVPWKGGGYTHLHKNAIRRCDQEPYFIAWKFLLSHCSPWVSFKSIPY